MLSEIICDKFLYDTNKERGVIRFYPGLNIVRGHNTGTNSIGKSTFLLVVDFVFGGNTYIKQVDIFEKVGHHTINFCFIFNEVPYYFCRNTENPEFVYECDETYIKKSKIYSRDDFVDLLKNLYGFQIENLSFRETVSTFFRINGKDNLDFAQPFYGHNGDSAEKSLVRTLKLYNKYQPLADQNAIIQAKKEYRQAVQNAEKHNIIQNINTLVEYKANEEKINLLLHELNKLQENGYQELSKLDPEEATKIAELKIQYEEVNRIRKQLWTKFYAIKEMKNNKRIASNNEFMRLIDFFPSANIKLLSDIEKFHKSLYEVLTSEFEEAKKEILTAIDEQVKKLNEISSALKQYELPKRISAETLSAFSNIDNQIKTLQEQNKKYEQKRAFEKEFKACKDTYNDLFLSVCDSLVSIIDLELEQLSEYVDGKEIIPPELDIKSTKKYLYHTPGDTGTGTQHKNTILLDLTILKQTSLPAIAHDTILFKQLSQETTGKILELYSKSQKQIFISIDETLKYPINAQDIIINKTRIELADNGNELFGYSWRKRPSLDAENTTNE